MKDKATITKEDYEHIDKVITDIMQLVNINKSLEYIGYDYDFLSSGEKHDIDMPALMLQAMHNSESIIETLDNLGFYLKDIMMTDETKNRIKKSLE